MIFIILILIQGTAIPLYAVPGDNTAEDNQNNLTYPDFLNIQAASVFLTESRRGQVLYMKNPDEKLHISIINKIMTALLVVENGNLNDTVTISKESAESEGSIMFLEPGDKYLVEDLIYSIMLRSYNDAARALAEYAGGSIENFVLLMNNKAMELNLQNTHFTNPSGLYDEQQYTTAKDTAILLRHAIANPAFNRIFATKTKVWNGKDGSELLINQNRIFWELEGVDGGKIGFNKKDKYTAVTTATIDNQRLICILLDSPGDIITEDTKKLLDYGFGSFSLSRLVSKDESIEKIAVDDIEVDLVTFSDIYYTHPVNDDYIKDVTYDINENLTPPISKTHIVGVAKFILQDGTKIDVNLYPSMEIPAPESMYEYVKRKIIEHKDIFYLLLALVLIEVLLILIGIGKLFVKLINLIIYGKKGSNL